MEDRFIRGVFKALEELRIGLHTIIQKIQEKEERQPLLWNPLSVFENNNMFGNRVKLTWSKLSSGQTSSLIEWRKFT
jgi:hypothetical protein